MLAGWKPSQSKIPHVNSSASMTIINSRWAMEMLMVLALLLAGSTTPTRAASPKLPPISAGRYTIDSNRSRMRGFVRSTLHNFDTNISKFSGTMVLPKNGDLSFVQFRLSPDRHSP